MNASTPALPPASVLAFGQRIVFVEQIYFCAMYAVVIWDWLVSLRREWDLIWRKSWTPVKVIYLFCRYWPIIAVPYTLWAYTINHSVELCQRIYKSPVLLMMWNQLGAEVVLVVRTYAFVGRSRPLLLAMVAALLGVASYQIYVPLAQMNLLPFLTPPFDSGPCFPVAKPGSLHVTGFFVAPLVFDSILTLMTIYRALRMRWLVRGTGVASPVMATFVQEGLWYFILISGANLINGIFYFQRNAALQALNIPLSIMFPNILACRMILGLRARGATSDLHVSTGGSASGSMRFKSGGGGRSSHGRKLTALRGTTTDCSTAVPDAVDLVELASETGSHKVPLGDLERCDGDSPGRKVERMTTGERI